MKIIKLIIGLIFISNFVFGTAQVPDILIYEGNAYSLLTNPLEDYYNDTNPRPNNFYVAGYGTACWRNYRAVWEITDNKLYLIAILNCGSGLEYKITENTLELLKNDSVPENVIKKLNKIKNNIYNFGYLQKVLKNKIGRKNYKKYKDLIFKYKEIDINKEPLELLFKDLVENGKVYAFWYSGNLRVPIGNLVLYEHMGYMSVYDTEIIFNVINGDILDFETKKNSYDKIKEDYTFFQSSFFSTYIPKKLLIKENDYEYIEKDTFELTNNDKTMSMFYLAKFHERRKTQQLRKEIVKYTIDSLLENENKTYLAEERISDENVWGCFEYVDLEAENTRIYAISNINSMLIIIYNEKLTERVDFKSRADYIMNSIILMEYGY